MKKSLLFILTCLVAGPIFSQNFKFGKVSKDELTEKVYALDSTANAVYLYRETKVHYEYRSGTGFELVTDVHLRIKLYNKDAFDYATIGVRYYKPDSGSKESVSAIKGYTYNLEAGNVVKTKLSKKGVFNEKLNKFRSIKKITMPNIKEGSVIELRYRISSPFARSIDDFQFQYNIPVKKLDYKASIPQYYVFRLQTKGYYRVPYTKNSFNGRISSELKTMINTHQFLGENIPALKDDEPFVSTIRNYRGGVKFELIATQFPNSLHKQYSTTWEEVVSTIYKSTDFGDALLKSRYFKKDLLAVLHDGMSDSERIAAVLKFIKSKVKWNDYYGKYAGVGVKKAYKTGVGNVADINLMLVAMLRHAGLDANPVLVSTRNNGIPFFPTREGFNYVIAAVTSPSGNILLDATEEFSFSNTLPLRALNWKGRLVKKDGTSSWVPLTPSKRALEDHTIAITIDEDLEVEGMFRTKYSQLNAAYYRKGNNEKKEIKVIANLEEKHGIEIEKFKIANADKIEKSIVRTTTFSSEELIEEINDKLYISPLLFLGMKTNPFQSKTRKFPIDFGYPWEDKFNIFITIPDGYKVGSLPETVGVGMRDQVGMYKFKAQVTGNKIRVFSQIVMNEGIISFEYYEELKALFDVIVKKQLEKIELIKI